MCIYEPAEGYHLVCAGGWVGWVVGECEVICKIFFMAKPTTVEVEVGLLLSWGFDNISSGRLWCWHHTEQIQTFPSGHFSQCCSPSCLAVLITILPLPGK